MRNVRQQPARDLPVATRPAVPACDVGAVARRIALIKLHVAEQARPRVTAFEQVVAQDTILRKPACEGLLECVYVVDAFAYVGAFAEEVLVNVGHRARIRVDAGLAAAEPRIPRAVQLRQARSDARLQNAVTSRYA